MKNVYKVMDNEEKEVLNLIPPEFFVDYIYDSAQSIYVLKIEEKIFGTALIRKNGDDAIIEYMYVNEDNKEEYAFLINSISYDMYKDGAKRIIWKFMEENEELIHVIKMLDFVINEDALAMFEFKINDLDNCEILKKPVKDVIALKELDNIHLRDLCNRIIENGEAIVDMPIEKESYIENCSAVYIEDNKAKAIILVKENTDDTLEIPFIYSESHTPVALIELIKFIYQKANIKYDKAKLCRTYIVEPVLVKIIEKLTGLKGKYQKSAVRELQYLSFFDDIELDADF
ncbi:MAG: hypothetical protein IJA34_13695 [Lachnospiraceae bacterium]|nr:hypothetical protein [Lachnospiraceae bacterium]